MIDKINNVEEFKEKGKEACEKNDYELYKTACCVLHLYTKNCSPCKEVAVSALYDLLTNAKSEEFLAVATEIMNNNQETKGDAIVYYLLLSVRTDHEIIMTYLLSLCDKIQMEILDKMEQEEKSEKRE